MNKVKQAIREKAQALGFDAVGFCSADTNPRRKSDLAAFLDLGRHGDMAWMADTAERRAAPQALWPEACSIVVLGMNYGPASDPLAGLHRRRRGMVSVYAQGADYHSFIKKRLKQLAQWICERHGGQVKVFVDTAPVMEKPLAASAGIGWQGKHSNLVSRDFGSWLFLAEVFTTLELPPDDPATDLCGSCNRCQEACPTGALSEAYKIDASRCISYLTIERKGTIPDALKEKMGNRIFGCDDCLAVCPWNKYASPSRHDRFFPRPQATAPRLADLAGLDDAAFREVFAGSPIKRLGRDRLLRNLLFAVGNSGDASLAKTAQGHLDSPSRMVREAAAWAFERLRKKPSPPPR